MTYTLQERSKMDREYGSLRWVEVTTFGDPGPRFLCVSPRCEYCKSPVADEECIKCGAGPRDGVR